MTNRPKIIVVGGGTAGWISLAYLAATVDAELTIIHSRDIDIMGVGESTTPTIKHVAETVGVDERKWMREGRATYKYGIEFLNFHRPGSRWAHLFDDLLPGQTFNTPISDFGKTTFSKNASSVEYFLKQRQLGRLDYDIDFFNRSHGGCDYLLKHRLSPYDADGQVNFSCFPGYAYHINAFDFGQTLKKATPTHRYREIEATIKHVEVNESGVSYLELEDGTRLSADLYIDCSGFNKLLIGKFVEFKPYHGLLNNAAVWGPVKNLRVDRPSTISTAQDVGWIWETPTTDQVGSGYVYSTDFRSEQQAIDHLTEHWRQQGHHWEPLRSVKFNSGRLERIAYKNIVANGLGQSFIEPLEATAIMTTCVTIRNMVRLWNKHQGWKESSARTLSTLMEKFLLNTKDFVLSHYTLSDRRDTDYWRAYDHTNSTEFVSQMIENKFNQSWAEHADTVLNAYNWTSMLVGYDKPYLAKLPDINAKQLKNYEFYTQQLIANYQHLYADNQSIRQRLDYNCHE